MSTVHVEFALSAPADEVGALLAAIPEDQWFERKSARIAARDLADSLIGFGNARAIAAALREASRLSTGEVAEMLDVSRPIAQRELSTLREAGVVDWVGKSPRDPRAFWRLHAN